METEQQNGGIILFFYRIPLYIYLKLFEYNDLKVNFDLSHYVLPLNDLTFVFLKKKQVLTEYST